MTSRLLVVFALVCFSFVGAFAQAQIAADLFASPSRVNTPNDHATRRASRVGMTVEQQIQQELNAKTSFHFIEEPLESAIQSISQQHDIPIVLNRVALENSVCSPTSSAFEISRMLFKLLPRNGSLAQPVQA